jgi:RHS repeat-associated protein
VRDAIEQAGDALGRIVMLYAYDMLGNRIHQLSMEAGARWMLNDVAAKPVRAWDSRGHNFATAYDALRRVTEQYVQGTFSDPDPLKPNSDPRTLNPPDVRGFLADKIEYGEPPLNATPAQEQEAQRLNLRTRIYRHFDSAGVATNARLDASGNPTEAYDFKGNLLRSSRRLITDYKAIPNWLLNPQLDAESFEGSTRYDALNRPVQSVAPHSNLIRAQHTNKINVIQPVFNEANLLERLDVWLERAAEPAALLDPAAEAASPVGVANIDYDAKGQRQRIYYKNGASTFYSYDPLTFRLTQLLTKRKAADFPGDDPQPPVAGWPGRQVQNLHYTYDPSGNITHIQDDAQQIIYFRNKRVEPSNDYVYDALYRLIQATGREHLGQTGGVPNPPSSPDAFNAFHTRLDHRGNGDAMGTYIERSVYDAVGNFLQMQHHGADPAHPGWTRAYDYLEASLIEDGSGGTLLKTSNRLSRTELNPNGANPPLVEPYQHDTHGNMVRMPHLGAGLPGPNMHWDYKDQLRQIDKGGGGSAYYVYDTSGQRVRKVWEKSPGLTEERIYLGGFEIFRKHGGPIGANTATLERETLHVMDDKQRIALVETRTLDPAGDDQAPRQLIRYQFGNHLGSASLELGEQAQMISYEEYAPYGSSTYQAVRSQTETAKRYRYTGKERDEESGLYYHGARYCIPWLGRWGSCDASTPDGLNLYLYAHSNPVRWYDPDGLAGKDSVPRPSFDIIQGSGPQSIPSDVPTQKKMWEALQDYAKKTGINPKDLVWMHPEDKPKGLTRAGERTTVTLGTARENAERSGKERMMVQEARKKGEFSRDTSGNDPNPPEGSSRRPRLAPELTKEPLPAAAPTAPKLETPKVEAPKVEAPAEGGWTTEVPKTATPSGEITIGKAAGLIGLVLLFLDLREALGTAKTSEERNSIIAKHAAMAGGSTAAYWTLMKLLGTAGFVGTAEYLSGAAEGLVIGQGLRKLAGFSKEKTKDFIEWAARKVNFDLEAWNKREMEKFNQMQKEKGSNLRLVQGY